MTKLDEIGNKLKALMWVKMEEIYNEEYNNKVRTSPHKTTQARCLEELKDEILNYFNNEGK